MNLCSWHEKSQIRQLSVIGMRGRIFNFHFQLQCVQQSEGVKYFLKNIGIEGITGVPVIPDLNRFTLNSQSDDSTLRWRGVHRKRQLPQCFICNVKLCQTRKMPVDKATFGGLRSLEWILSQQSITAIITILNK